MSSYNPPYPYYNGIPYNKAFFTTSGTSLTKAQANALYLQKTLPDTATSLETFNAGINSNSIDVITNSSDMDIALGNLTGKINIGTGNYYAGDINIATGLNNGSSITIGDVTTTVGMYGNQQYFENPVSANFDAYGGNFTLCASIDTGDLTIAPNVTIGRVFINTNVSATGPTTIGNANGTTNINSALNLAKPIKLGSLPTLNTQLGYTLTSTFTSVAIVSGGTANIIISRQITTAGLYLVNWSIQYGSAVGTIPTVYYSNVANTTTAVLKTPLISVSNWGNSSLGAPGGAPFQCSSGSMVISITANNYLNLLLYFTGTGVLTTDSGYLAYTRIA